jgi:hypothetical protein
MRASAAKPRANVRVAGVYGRRAGTARRLLQRPVLMDNRTVPSGGCPTTSWTLVSRAAGGAVGAAAAPRARHGRWVAMGAVVNALLSVIALRATVDGVTAAASGVLAALDALDVAIAACGPLLAGLALIAVAGMVTATLDYRWQDRPAGGDPARDRWLLPAATVALVGGLLWAALPLVGVGPAPEALRQVLDLAQLGAAVGVWRELLDARRRSETVPARMGWRVAAALTAASFFCGLGVLLA